GITVAAILAVFGTGLWVNARETQLADARLGQLTDRIVAAQEDERARVSRDLHDGISQILVATKLALERARLMLSRPAGGPSSSMAHDDIARADTTLDLAIREVRRISQDLRPGVLDDLGLGEALNDLAANFEAQFGVACDVERADMPERLPAAIETTLYRIAQEALTNVERHARAQSVMLRLSVTERAGEPLVTLWVIDDGIGFAEPQTVEGGETRRRVPRVPSGMGLRNMEKRLEPFGGRLIVQSRSTGTRIGAELPLRQQVHAAKPSQSALRDDGAGAATDRAMPTETSAPSESQTS
ncbi:MAG: histidine kinase, partial [Pseudomonadota bacterium]